MVFTNAKALAPRGRTKPYLFMRHAFFPAPASDMYGLTQRFVSQSRPSLRQFSELPRECFLRKQAPPIFGSGSEQVHWYLLARLGPHSCHLLPLHNFYHSRQ